MTTRLALLILLWDPEDPAVTSPIRSRFPQLEANYFCLRTASAQLLAESANSSSVRPARYVFTELLRNDRDFDVETQTASNQIRALLLHTSILASHSLLPPSRDLVPKSVQRCLSWIHVFSAGVDLIAEHTLVINSPFEITTSRGIHGVQIAEWVVMTILAARKSFTLTCDLQRRQEWPSDKIAYSKTTSLHSLKVGIIGYGSIGRQIARVLSTFGCIIIVHTASPHIIEASRVDHGFILPGTGDPTGCIPTAWSSGTDKASLHAFLSQDIDILVLALPMTAKTHHLLSGPEFEVLCRRKRCFLVNVARGRVIDQSALVTALNDGSLSGAALDVTTPEPLPPGDLLWSAKNVIITPHISSLGPDYLRNAMEVLATNIKRREANEQLLNLYDRTKGY